MSTGITHVSSNAWNVCPPFADSNQQVPMRKATSCHRHTLSSMVQVCCKPAFAYACAASLPLLPGVASSSAGIPGRQWGHGWLGPATGGPHHTAALQERPWEARQLLVQCALRLCAVGGVPCAWAWAHVLSWQAIDLRGSHRKCNTLGCDPGSTVTESWYPD